MKRIFESDFVGYDESATRIVLFMLDEDEYDEIDDMNHDEHCELCGVFDESGYDVAPGALYHTYDFYLHSGFFVMYETHAYNI